MKIKELIDFIEDAAPKNLAVSGDVTGFLLGDMESDIRRAMVCMDVTSDAIGFAVENRVNFIISHHPLIFSPIENLDYRNYENRKIADLIKNDISVYAAHTNLDSAYGGINDCLAEEIGLSDIELLEPKEEKIFKVLTYVPEEYKEPVIKAAAGKGAGKIGEYTNCCFESMGIGRFTASDVSDPFIKEGISEEVKIEFQVQTDCVKDVYAAISEAHPYETPVIEITILENKNILPSLGRIGDINPVSGREFTEIVKEKVNLNLRHNGIFEKEIRKVCVCGGSGMSLFEKVLEAKADAFVTSEVKHHQFLMAKEMEVLLIDAGHFETEIFGVKTLFEKISEVFKDTLFYSSKY